MPIGKASRTATIPTTRKTKPTTASKVENKDGVVPKHVGKSRIEVFEAAMQYLESHVLPTTGFTQLVADIERVVKQQLEIEAADCTIHFGQPSADYFFDNLTFFIRDHADKPRLPITSMGNGFVSLFAVALIRAIVKSDVGGNIFIIEEPETFQHEHFQEYFYKVLCEVAEKNQVIYTTHSKKFVNVFHPESIIRFSNPDRLALTSRTTSRRRSSSPRSLTDSASRHPKISESTCGPWSRTSAISSSPAKS